MILKKVLSYIKNRLLEYNQRSRGSISYTKAKDIGIIFSNDTPSNIKLVEQLNILLKADDKKIEILIFNCNKQSEETLFPSFSREDIKFGKFFTNSLIRKFVATPFDFLFCLDNHPNNITQYILAKNKAKCRVGICDSFKDYSVLFELIIQNKTNTNLIIDDVYTYIKKIH